MVSKSVCFLLHQYWFIVTLRFLEIIQREQRGRVFDCQDGRIKLVLWILISVRFVLLIRSLHRDSRFFSNLRGVIFFNNLIHNLLEGLFAVILWLFLFRSRVEVLVLIFVFFEYTKNMVKIHIFPHYWWMSYYLRVPPRSSI